MAMTELERMAREIFDESLRQAAVRSITDPDAAKADGDALIIDAIAKSLTKAPPGWKLVPAEATSEMIKAATSMHSCETGGGDGWYSISDISESDVISILQAMLAAAPEYKEQ